MVTQLTVTRAQRLNFHIIPGGVSLCITCIYHVPPTRTVTMTTCIPMPLQSLAHPPPSPDFLMYPSLHHPYPIKTAIKSELNNNEAGPGSQYSPLIHYTGRVTTWSIENQYIYINRDVPTSSTIALRALKKSLCNQKKSWKKKILLKVQMWYLLPTLKPCDHYFH